MHENQIERKAIRTVRRKKFQDLLAVLFFLLLLPYACSALTGQSADMQGNGTSGGGGNQAVSGQSAAVETSASGQFAAASAVSGQTAAASNQTSAVSGSRYVRWEMASGVWRIPEEEFLVGALAASIPGYYREETLKAQAVILRSASRAAQGTDGSTSRAAQNNSYTVLKDSMSYLDSAARRELWQENFDEYEEKFTRAVQATSGIVLLYGGEIVSPPYFRLSAGQTRSSAQIWEEGGFSWCRSVSCPHNLEADEYLQTVTVKRSTFLKKLSQEGIELPETGARMALTRDSAGYVLYVECGGKRIEGERFRTLFELPSANFSIREEGKKLIFSTRGVGHGLGFDQYAADLLAAAGLDYQELLQTFFEGLTLEKVE